MKININSLTAFLFLSLVYLAGCDSLRQEVDPARLTREPEKLVIACFISPQDTILAARVSKSSPVLGVINPGRSDVADAVVTLSDGSRSVTLRFMANQPDQGQGLGMAQGYYRADARQLPILAGKTYTLTVRTPDGKQVDATCVVPGPVALQRVVVDSAVTNDFGRTRKEYFARFFWRDPAGQANFYRVAGANDYLLKVQYRLSPTAPMRDTLFQTTGNLSFTPASTSTDQGNDGQELVSGRGRLAVSYSWTNGQSQPSRPAGQLYAYLLNTDINYYQYHDSVQRQSNTGDNPFAEPVPLITNIRGGLGCFGAYNQTILTVKLK